MFDQICWRRKSHTNNFFILILHLIFLVSEQTLICHNYCYSRASTKTIPPNPSIIIPLPGKTQLLTSRSQWHSKHLNCQTTAITSYNTTASPPSSPNNHLELKKLDYWHHSMAMCSHCCHSQNNSIPWP